MKYFLSILLFCFGNAYSQTNCDNFPENYIPDDLNDAIFYLDCKWSLKDKEEFKKQPEKEAVATLHFGTGLSIRNGWDLWKGRNSLVQYFNSIGIFHPDDMSSIILTSFHRKLNNEDVNLEAQVAYYQDYWNKIKEEHLEHNKIYKTLKIGDTIVTAFSKLEATRETYSLAFLSYHSNINDTAHCFITGIVANKNKKKGICILTIQVVSAKNCSCSHLGDKVIITGQKFTYNMTYFNITR